MLRKNNQWKKYEITGLWRGSLEGVIQHVQMCCNEKWVVTFHYYGAGIQFERKVWD